MNRYLFVIAIANLDSEEPSPADIQFLHEIVEANDEETAYTLGQCKLADALQDATEAMTIAGETWVANDYVIPVPTMPMLAPGPAPLRVTQEVDRASRR